MTPAQVENMNLKITELQSKFKKPNLKRVKISAEAMLSVLLGSKHKESIDFKANLKTVKKEEEKVSPAFAFDSHQATGNSYFSGSNYPFYLGWFSMTCYVSYGRRR